MAKNMTSEGPSINILTSGTSVSGEITSDGDLRIDGTLKGSVACKGKVVIGTTGRLEGDVTCSNIDISGYMEGKVEVAELLSLKSTAEVKGDVITARLSIEPGALFTGTCRMDGGGAKGTATPKDESPKTEKGA